MVQLTIIMISHLYQKLLPLAQLLIPIAQYPFKSMRSQEAFLLLMCFYFQIFSILSFLSL